MYHLWPKLFCRQFGKFPFTRLLLWTSVIVRNDTKTLLSTKRGEDALSGECRLSILQCGLEGSLEEDWHLVLCKLCRCYVCMPLEAVRQGIAQLLFFPLFDRMRTRRLPLRDPCCTSKYIQFSFECSDVVKQFFPCCPNVQIVCVMHVAAKVSAANCAGSSLPVKVGCRTKPFHRN